MELLAQLHVLLKRDHSSDSAHVRQLWPFLRHNLAAVRAAAVKLFTSMVAMTSGKGERPAPCLFQRLSPATQSACGTSTLQHKPSVSSTRRPAVTGDHVFPPARVTTQYTEMRTASVPSPDD